MNWNPFKRIAGLEQEVIDLREQARHLNVRLDLLRSVIGTVRSEGEPVFTEAEVANAAEQKRLKQNEYNKAYRAKQKAKVKQNEYQRAYRARKKAEKAAAQAIGGAE